MRTIAACCFILGSMSLANAVDITVTTPSGSKIIAWLDTNEADMPYQETFFDETGKQVASITISK